MPVVLTEPTDGLLLDQTTEPAPTAVPEESEAVSCAVSPANFTNTDGATRYAPGEGPVTVTLPVALFPLLDAVIVHVPALRPVTIPVVATLATVVSLEDQAMSRPMRTLPALSAAVAANVTVAPTAIEAEGGTTETLATGTAATVILVDPVFASTVAVIVAVPTVRALTNPVLETVTMDVSLAVHVTVRPVTGVLDALRGVADSVDV
jgi:hypothetical protein